MHAAQLLHDLFDNAFQSIDKRLNRTLFESAEALIRCKRLSIVSIGRSLNRPALVKHNIKCIDRLFGNKTLHSHHVTYYREFTHILLKNNLNPLIVVDWSGLTKCGAYHFLRAAVTVNGRTLTLYDRAYPLRECYKNKTHKNFLITLKSILPEGCSPIIVTDAGFRNTWFKAVMSMGWDFVGRVRNLTHYRTQDSIIWKPIKYLYKNATKRASYVGKVVLAKCNPLACHFYLSKQRKKHRVKRNLIGRKVQCSSSKKHEKRENEPWLIVSSLSTEKISANEVMLIYKKRMQIEEAFRDLKNTRHGLGLRHCRSYQTQRLNVALLISSLAMIVMWLLGVAAKMCKIHYSFQTNTVKNKNVLSNMFIGWQVLQRSEVEFNKKELLEALDTVIAATFWRIN